MTRNKGALAKEDLAMALACWQRSGVVVNPRQLWQVFPIIPGTAKLPVPFAYRSAPWLWAKPCPTFRCCR